MRPAEVEQLIEDLRRERPRSTVVSQPESELVIHIEDTGEKLTFNEDESKLLLANSGTVSRLYEALDYPSETCIELHEMVVDSEVMAELEGYASTVDEM